MASCLSKNEALNICLVKRFHCTAPNYIDSAPHPHTPPSNEHSGLDRVGSAPLSPPAYIYLSQSRERAEHPPLLGCCSSFANPFHLGVGSSNFSNTEGPNWPFRCWNLLLDQVNRSIPSWWHDDWWISVHLPQPPPLFCPFEKTIFVSLII